MNFMVKSLLNGVDLSEKSVIDPCRSWFHFPCQRMQPDGKYVSSRTVEGLSDPFGKPSAGICADRLG
jgi:hypothetical protein